MSQSQDEQLARIIAVVKKDGRIEILIGGMSEDEDDRTDTGPTGTEPE